MTRVLFATDLSEAAGVAERLICSIPWPAETSVRVVTVVPWLADLVGTPWMAVVPMHADEIETDQVSNAEQRVRAVVARLQTRGLAATWVVMRGQAADAIVEVAAHEDVDLVVVGSRGLGALEGALLGSVSEAVADRAPCPVLVARSDSIQRSLIADDGSEGARLALDYVLGRPYLLGTETHVVGVFGAAGVWGETFDMPIDAHSVQVLADDEAALRAATRTAVESSAARLRDAGQPSVAEFLVGQPGEEIVDAALACHGDLVVVGSRHRTGLARLVLGSVGRYVLHHSHCSVLMVGRVLPSAGLGAIRGPAAAGAASRASNATEANPIQRGTLSET